MGGLGPGIGGLEILVIGLVALLVVGPKDLPVLMRKVGQFMARARAMANDFRASFDEMARQSELDELRREVQALKSGTNLNPLGPDAEAAFRDIRSDLSAPLAETPPAPMPAPAASTTAVAEPAPMPGASAGIEPPPTKPVRKRAATTVRPGAATTKSAAKSVSKSANKSTGTTARNAPSRRTKKADL